MTQNIILVIEDQKAMASLLQEKISQQTTLPVITAHSLKEAKEVIDSDVKVLVCVTDLNLPDTEEGASVPLLLKKNITTVVLTADYTEETRKKMFKQHVADYVIKDGMAAINYAVRTVISLVENSDINIWLLALDNNKTTRRLLGLLNIQRYHISVFEDSQSVLKTLPSKMPDLLILTGVASENEKKIVDMISSIRENYTQNQLPLMLCDDSHDMAQVIKLMKYGVNDFYNSGFTAEELTVRVNLNISQAINYKKLERISQVDALTDLYNRRYFFEKSESVIKECGAHCFAVMLDIDFFKVVNDTYGHAKGDEAIIFVANVIQDTFDSFVVARLGGEEFCVLGGYEELSKIQALCETVRQFIESESKNKIGIPITISIGLSTNNNLLTLDDLVSEADKALYASKESGRNKVSLQPVVNG
ncbi:diguanylate cyclase [Thiomicrorhabdus sp. Kp2]|uniref:diguanylate cyclase n=1 Tax=Thiomicrorhabdus sp. Kp2 TaxID=1123518 RepID=UPI0003F86198|nr:diguanylate cyclase [Thiomicrorhabdus sp. Kp2]